MPLKKLAIRQIDARGGITKRKVHSVAIIGNNAGHTNLGKDTEGVAHAVAQRLERFGRTYSAPQRGRIAHSRLPKPHEVEGIALSWLVERLEGFPAREYSIASLPQSGRMELLVRKAVREDGSLGLGSGWLTHVAAPGGVIKLRLRPNPNFHPPRDGAQILIGAGTGMAGLRAHLQHRQTKNLREAWLLFGERGEKTDLYYANDIKAWQADGTLARTDLVFSRDASPKRYVQNLVSEQGADIARWIEGGASILVCGGLQMAAGVQAALVKIVGQEKLDLMSQDGLYRRDIY